MGRKPIYRIPIKTYHWDVTQFGFLEADTLTHYIITTINIYKDYDSYS